MGNGRNDGPKRVLMTADSVGGVWTYALELARGLSPYGVEVMLATMGKLPTRDQLDEARSIGNLRLFKSEYKLEWMDGCWRDVERAGDWLLNLESRLRPDMVHLNGYAHASLPFRARKVVVGHSCVLSWWRAVKNCDPPAELSKYREVVARGLRSADVTVAPTTAMLNALEENYGRIPRTAVVPNGRDPKNFSAAKKGDMILAAGRLWDEAKNISLLTRIAESIPGQVVVAGEHQDPQGRSRPRLNKVKVLGRLSSYELARYMSKAPVFALPAVYEPFGLTPLEAGLSGCALVLGDIPSLREVWGDSAVFVPPRDEERWAATLRNLMTDRDRLNQLAYRARQHARLMSTQKMAAGYLRIYQNLLSPARRTAREEAIV